MGRKGYPVEFRRRALDLVAAGRPITDVERDFGDLLAASGGMQGLKEVRSTVVQDALRSDPGGGDRPVGCGPLGTLGGAERDAQRVAVEDGVDPRGRRRGQDPQAPEGFVLPGAARAAPSGRPGPVEGDHDRLRGGHVHTEGRRPRQSARVRVGRVEVHRVTHLCGHRP